ncbi:MAG: primosomal protein N' [Candidatus Saccharimonas sp.]
MFFYEVAPTKIVRAGSDFFTYHYSSQLSLGMIVSVPVGKQMLTGVIIRSVSQPLYETKAINSILYENPLPNPLFHTINWIASYYAAPLAMTLQTALPSGITKKRRQLKETSPAHRRERTHFLLNEYQQKAVEQISHAQPGTFILHGITGSGKTAVYIELARKQLALGKSFILVIPEIALTSQLVGEFSNEFDNIIVAHSRQTESERHTVWEKALAGSQPYIAIGPRSVLFLPLVHVGAIAIDEAHEPSLKQDQTPRYSALRVASILGKQHGAYVIQGSATPLISEYYLATSTHHPIIELPEKARRDAIAPKVTVVDMTKRTNFVHHRFVSDALIQRIAYSLENSHQTLIFHNRRGSASTTLCEQCGWSAICPRCVIPFTLHADAHQLRCHICGTLDRIPTSCPTCQSTSIIHKGIGTKLIESELRKLFPKARIARFDADSATGETIDQRYNDIYDGSIDIVIGTQVVAKGLDLPQLRTVGIVQADAGLSLPDFMSSERTFQLLAQTVGRVGRSSHETAVIIQTYQPEAPAIQYGISQNYHAFYKHTLEERRRGKFPPFVYLLKLTCVYKTEAAAIRNSKQLAKKIRESHPTLTIFGPTPAFYEKQHGTYRWQIVVKSPSRGSLVEVLTSLPPAHWQYELDPLNLL